MTLDFVFKTITGHDTNYWLDRGDLDWFSEYADKREDAGKGILTANWNNFPRPDDKEFNWSSKGQRFQHALESLGYQLEWSDQTNRCGHCSGAIHEGPAYPGDTAHYAVLEGDIVCEACIRADFAEEYLEGLEVTRRSGPFHAMNISGIDPADYGYEKIQGDFESGFHPGQNDNPKEIYAKLDDQGITNVLFSIDGAGQFDIRFSVWRKTQVEA